MDRVTAICRTSGIHVQTFAFKRKRRKKNVAFNVWPILVPPCTLRCAVRARGWGGMRSNFARGWHLQVNAVAPVGPAPRDGSVWTLAVWLQRCGAQ
jgi:hypothetical protein